MFLDLLKTCAFYIWNISDPTLLTNIRLARWSNKSHTNTLTYSVLLSMTIQPIKLTNETSPGQKHLSLFSPTVSDEKKRLITLSPDGRSHRNHRRIRSLRSRQHFHRKVRGSFGSSLLWGCLHVIELCTCTKVGCMKWKLMSSYILIEFITK